MWCAECGEPYWVLPSRAKGPATRLYCSSVCGRLGGGRKRSLWGKEHRKSDAYGKAQSKRTQKSWLDPEKRANHERAMQTPEYRELRSKNMKRITSTDSWKKAVQDYARSDRCKEILARRRKPKWPNWTVYTDPKGVKHKFRSSWEKLGAETLDSLYWKWQYEPRRFTLVGGRTYLPDFRVWAPFGMFYLEIHRIQRVRPGDEKKVALLKQIVREGLLDAPLVLLDEIDIADLRRLQRMSSRKKQSSQQG